MKEKIETKEEISNDHRHTCPKVKSPSSTSAEVHEQLPGKLKLKQSPKNISTEPNQEAKRDSKQNEHASKTGNQQLLLNKPKPGKNTEDKSELKCKPKASQNTSATEPKKDLGVEVKIHQETIKAEDSLTVTASEKRESESASSGGSENDVGQCAGMVPQNTTSLEASKEPSTQDEVVIGRLIVLTFGNFYTFIWLLMCITDKIIAGVVLALPPVSYSSRALTKTL